MFAIFGSPAPGPPPRSRRARRSAEPWARAPGCWACAPTARATCRHFTLLHGGRAWRLCSALIGSEFCGHQIALALHGRDQRKWALYDADAVRDGIGPLAWDIGEDTGQAEWWAALEWLVPVMNSTKSSRFCDMNPRNRHPSEPLAAAFGAAGDRAAQSLLLAMGQGPRTVNIDWIYTEAPAGDRAAPG